MFCSKLIIHTNGRSILHRATQLQFLPIHFETEYINTNKHKVVNAAPNEREKLSICPTWSVLISRQF